MFRAMATGLFGLVLSVAPLGTDVYGQVVSAEHVVVSPGDTVTVGVLLDLTGPQAVQGYGVSVIVDGSFAAGLSVPSAQTGSDILAVLMPPPNSFERTTPAVDPGTGDVGVVSEALRDLSGGLPFPMGVYRAAEFDVVIPLTVPVGTVFPVEFRDGGVGIGLPTDNLVTIGGFSDPFPSLVAGSITVVERGVSGSIEDVIACPGETVRVGVTLDIRAHPDVAAYQLSVLVDGSAAAGLTVPNGQTGADIVALVVPGGSEQTNLAMDPATGDVGAVSAAIYRTAPGGTPFPKGVYLALEIDVTIPPSVPSGTVFSVEFRDGGEVNPGVPLNNFYVEGTGGSAAFLSLLAGSITVLNKSAAASVEHVTACPGDTVTVGVTLDLQQHPTVQGFSFSVVVVGSAAAGLSVPSANTGASILALLLPPPDSFEISAPAVLPATSDVGAVSAAVRDLPNGTSFPVGVYLALEFDVTIPLSVPGGTVFPVEFLDGAQGPGLPVLNTYTQGGISKLFDSLSPGSITVVSKAMAAIKPGDANQDGALDIADAAATLAWFFAGVDFPAPRGSELCFAIPGIRGEPDRLTEVGLRSLDWNCDRVVDLGDPVSQLAWQFQNAFAHSLLTQCRVLGCATQDCGNCIEVESSDCISTCTPTP